jgi:hypothetical protein
VWSSRSSMTPTSVLPTPTRHNSARGHEHFLIVSASDDRHNRWHCPDWPLPSSTLLDANSYSSRTGRESKRDAANRDLPVAVIAGLIDSTGTARRHGWERDHSDARRAWLLGGVAKCT